MKLPEAKRSTTNPATKKPSILPRVRLLAAAALALGACAAPAPPADAPADAPAEAPGDAALAPQWRAQYAALAAGGTVYALDPQRSRVRIYAFRGGRAAHLGHNHVLSAPAFSGWVYVPASGGEGGRVDIEMRLDALELDRTDIRATLGPAFAARIDADDVDNTRRHMLGNGNLQAQRFPFVRLHSLAITGELPRLAAQVDVELHGQHRPVWVALAVDRSPGGLTAAGSLVLRQTDFGITPYSVLGGMLAVEDALVVEFDLAATAAGPAP